MSRDWHCVLCGVFTGPKPEHPCAWSRTEPDLPREPTDVTFLREGRNSADGMERYRRHLERTFKDG